MQFQDELKAIAEEVASSPRVSATIQVATATLGTAWFADLIQGTLSAVAILSGVIATFLLGRVHWITAQNRQIENKLLRDQAKKLGIDLTKD